MEARESGALKVKHCLQQVWGPVRLRIPCQINISQDSAKWKLNAILMKAHLC